jgi:hypothetical protein
MRRTLLVSVSVVALLLLGAISPFAGAAPDDGPGAPASGRQGSSNWADDFNDISKVFSKVFILAKLLVTL